MPYDITVIPALYFSFGSKCNLILVCAPWKFYQLDSWPLKKMLIGNTLIWFFVVQLFGFTVGSPGDNLDEFDDCLFQCRQIACYNNPYHILQEEYKDIWATQDLEYHRYEPLWHFDSSLPWYLKLLLWNCPSNCDYTCQRIITKERKENHDEVYQFHGKWPFLRVFGIQEFASMVFSLCNFIPHYLGYKKIKKTANENPQSKQILSRAFFNLKLMAVITQMAWIFSAIFHVRDFDITEKLDYYFAGLTVLSGFYNLGFRYFKLYLHSRRFYGIIFTFLCIAAYAGHIYRLVTDWLYTYNMRANIFVGVLQNIFWGLSCYSLYTKYYEEEKEEKSLNLSHLDYVVPGRTILGKFYKKSPKLYSLYPLMMCFIVICGMALEIFDFPPFFFDLIDAHSLWHLVTIIPPVMGWYDWLIWDVNENVYKDIRAEIDKKEQ